MSEPAQPKRLEKNTNIGGAWWIPSALPDAFQVSSVGSRRRIIADQLHLGCQNDAGQPAPVQVTDESAYRQLSQNAGGDARIGDLGRHVSSRGSLRADPRHHARKDFRSATNVPAIVHP
jgi:hypothetical protein